MTLRFVNLFWPLLALGAVPLLVHLFARTRPPALRFSSVLFLRRVARHTMRMRKPRDLLVLLLRTLAALALVFMVLRPILFADARWLSPGARRNVVLVVDRSASMACNEGGRTRFAAACAEASEVLNGLTAADTANVVWLDARPRPVFPDMGVNRGFLRETLRKARVSTQAGAADEALRMAVRLLARAEGRKEVHVLSDFQEATWRSCAPDLPPDVAFYAIAIAQGEPANVAVADVRTKPVTGLPGEPVDVLIDVANHGDVPRRLDLFLSFGGARRRRDVLVPARETVTALFRQSPAARGEVLVTAALDIDEDGLTDDNRRYHVLPVREHLAVGLPEEHITAMPELVRALRALDWVQILPLPASLDAASEAPDVAFLLDVPAHDARRRQLLERGTTVLWQPPAGTSLASIDGLAGAEDGAAALQSGRDFRLRVVDRDDPALHLFRDARYGDPAAGTVRERLNLPRPRGGAGAVLMEYEDGVPAVVRLKGARQQILWNLPLGAERGDVARQVTFVPFIGELLRSHRLRAGRALAGLAFTAGDRLQRRFPGVHPVEEIRLHDSSHAAVDLQAAAGAGAASVFLTPDAPPLGAYTWHEKAAVLGYSVVNFPPAESDLRTLGRDRIESLGARGIADAATLHILHNGREIWHILLAVAALSLFTEALALFAFERR